MESNDKSEITQLINELSSGLNPAIPEIAIILAAGHGKRIKSHRSKMLHKIWEVPTVERVYNACRQGIKNINILVVVGIKAKDVMEVIGKREATLFAYQENQNGTGHAVQVALDRINGNLEDGIVYVLPGDMGLIDSETLVQFRDEFIKTGSDMLVLTGTFDGIPEENNYGRILRVKEKDDSGKSSGSDKDKVIEIIEYKDINSIPDDKTYTTVFNGRRYTYTKKELIANNEFNSSVYAFRYNKLVELIYSITSDNAQNEIYITDLISLFNKKGYSVNAVSPAHQYTVMGFNNKSVLKEMEEVARKHVYEKLKDIIEIKDQDDFFIHECVVDEIVNQDTKNIPLDIAIGKGVYIGKGVKLNYNLDLKNNVFVDGVVDFGKNVTVEQNTHLSCFPGQTFKIGDGVEILSGNIIKGNIEIGNNSRIESSVNMTGSDEFPLRIGKNVLIKGTSYIFGSVIEDDVHIEHSVIIKKRVEKLIKRDGSIQQIRFYLPMPEGLDAVGEL